VPRVPDEPRFHPWIWIVYALLLAVSIPWYFPREGPEPIWLGFPRWVTVSLMADVAMAVFTAFVIHRYWGEEDRL
jgi:hypothetical protein